MACVPGPGHCLKEGGAGSTSCLYKSMCLKHIGCISVQESEGSESTLFPWPELTGGRQRGGMEVASQAQGAHGLSGAESHPAHAGLSLVLS